MMKLIKMTVKSEWLDEETGEVITDERVLTDVKKPRESSSKKKVVEEDNDPTPKLTLEESKYHLNSAAIKSLMAMPGDKIDIKYQKVGDSKKPIIGLNIAFNTAGGNKLSKSNTVICKGANNERLSEYGNVFVLTQHPNNPDLFVLEGNAAPKQKPAEIVVPDEEEVDDFVSELMEETDTVTASDFNFTL